MNVNVVNGGEQAFGVILGGTPSQSKLNWLEQNIQQGAERLGNLGGAIVDRAVSLYDKFNNLAVINAGKQLLANTLVTDPNVIYPITDINGLPNANYIMQQYIMVNPLVDSYVSQGLLYGFADTYYDREPSLAAKDKSSYQAVMDGVVQVSDDEELYIMHYSNTSDEELTMSDKLSILDTWAQLEYAILESDFDPTEPLD